MARRERFDLIKAGATQTETSLLKQHAAGERVDLLDDYDFPARTITEIPKGVVYRPKKRSFLAVHNTIYPMNVVYFTNE